VKHLTEFHSYKVYPGASGVGRGNPRPIFRMDSSGYRRPKHPAALAKIGENLPPTDGRLTRRFRNLRAGKANALKITSSRRLLTAGYPATAATRVNFRESTIVGGVAFGPLPRSSPPPIVGGRSGSKSSIEFSKPDSRVACASLRRRERAQLARAAAYRRGPGTARRHIWRLHRPLPRALWPWLSPLPCFRCELFRKRNRRV